MGRINLELDDGRIIAEYADIREAGLALGQSEKLKTWIKKKRQRRINLNSLNDLYQGYWLTIREDDSNEVQQVRIADC